jgi:integrase
VTHNLGLVTTRGKKPPADIKTEAANHIAIVIESPIPPERTIGFADFVTGVYLPWVKESKKHAKQQHSYQGVQFSKRHGWHSARRGLGSNLYRLGVPDKVIQAILRHSNVNVTLGYYVKSASSDVMAAMEKFEEELTAQTLQDSQRTVKPDSDATSGFVN